MSHYPFLVHNVVAYLPMLIIINPTTHYNTSNIIQLAVSAVHGEILEEWPCFAKQLPRSSAQLSSSQVLLHFPQLGMPHYLMFSDIQMAQITAGYDLTG